jgi:hypothetical protein
LKPEWFVMQMYCHTERQLETRILCTVPLGDV